MAKKKRNKKTNTKQEQQKIEECLQSLELFDRQLDAAFTKEQIQRLQELDQKHSAFFLRSIKKTKGPKPTQEEILEYLTKETSLDLRIRATRPACTRIFLAENDVDIRPYWGYLETLVADLNTYPYAWLGIIMKDIQYKRESLQVLRGLLVYAANLMSTENIQYNLVNYRTALKCLHMSEKVMDVLGQTLSAETGDDRWELEYARYKHALYTSTAFAALGHQNDAMDYFREAAWEEQQYRAQARMEYKDGDSTAMAQLVNTPSVLQILSEDLNISRYMLDLSYEEENFDLLPVLDEVEAHDLWNCILSHKNQLWTDEPVEYCHGCWATGPNSKLKKCSRCQEASYCSRECQMEDWKNHKELCEPESSPVAGMTKTTGGKIETIVE